MISQLRAKKSIFLPVPNSSAAAIVRNMLLAAVSLFVNGFGVYLTIQANIGAGPWDVLTNDDVCDRAYLKRTSLYDLALKCGIDDPGSFVARFIEDERSKKREVSIGEEISVEKEVQISEDVSEREGDK